ncbi:MAG TPA: hydrogenase, partial [Candidatus Aminicenantes bacterium]|nr:hydrogenase [Candidatus Aminicenantes bacterium]
CQAREALAGIQVPARGHALRAAALELERLANHTGDLGAMAGDVGFLPTAAFCGRLRGDFLNMTAQLCGSRFGRGMVRPGGTAFDLDSSGADELRQKLTTALREVAGAVGLLWESGSVRMRFEETGTVSATRARELGLVGVAARACGLARDVRAEFPTGYYRFFQLPVSTSPAGDVFARAFVRWMEIERSGEFLLNLLQSMPAGPVRAEMKEPAAGMLAVSLTEGWRGEICHVLLTGDGNRLTAAKVVDPSFHNWTGLALALRGGQISDFPLCNKSFNLSYCGTDL